MSSPAEPIRVRLITHDALHAAAWRTALAGNAFHILSATESPQPADVVVADEAWEASPRECSPVVFIGEHTLADVCLPPDHLPRELTTAVRLLGRIARLTRENAGNIKRASRLDLLAHSDPLTGLPNRRAWDDRLQSLTADDVARACVAIIDLDHFKVINDQVGHGAGDRVLQAAAARLQKAIRAGDFLARIGGDEFGLLLLPCESAGAFAAVDRIRGAVAAAPADTSQAPITASAGVAQGGRLAGTVAAPADALIAAADAALRAAKNAGRDCSRDHA